jgi:hypothetical protein
MCAITFENVRHADVVQRGAHLERLTGRLRLLDEDPDQLFRMVVRQRAEQRGVDDAEERGRGADADRQRERRDAREAPVLAQHAQREDDVPCDRLHHATASHVVAAILNRQRIAESSCRQTSGFARARSAPLVLTRSHREMEIELLADFVGGDVGKQPSQSATERTKPSHV